jgi:hypothetical protein
MSSQEPGRSSYKIRADVGGDFSGMLAGGRDINMEMTRLTMTPDSALLNDITELRRALAELQLTRGQHNQVEGDVAAIEEAAKNSDPDKKAVGGRLESLTDFLASAGALASAGQALTGPLSRLAEWLGPYGQAILNRLN